MNTWHLITGEYPPTQGGVSDYTELIGHGLSEAGDNVHVWAPMASKVMPHDFAVTPHPLPDHYGRKALAALGDAFRGSNGARVLVQYLPHAFGMKAMNLPFCLWLTTHRRFQLDVMFHEVRLPFALAQSPHYNVIAAMNQLMAFIVARSASRIFVVTSAWKKLLRPLVPANRKIRCVPVPSTIPVVGDRAASNSIRARYVGEGGVLMGHFGTFGPEFRARLDAVLPPALNRDSRLVILLIGRNSENFARDFNLQHRELGNRVHSSGPLPADELSRHLSACDFALQPYPDGISTRHTSAMAMLAHGRAMVTTSGRLTESLWRESGAVSTAPDGDTQALAGRIGDLTTDGSIRTRLGAAGCELYLRQFDLRHTIDGLRDI